MKSSFVVLLVVLVCSYSISNVETACAGSGTAPVVLSTAPVVLSTEPVYTVYCKYFIKHVYLKINYNMLTI